MSLGVPRFPIPDSHPGEPGVGVDLAPPFTASDEPTRWLFGLNRFGIRPGLMRIAGLLEDLGHPEKKLRTLVVAGTNGKGSTTRILAHLLQSSGHKVVTYTSPHLLNVHERIRINDRAIDQADFSRRVEAIRPLTEKHEASWFETLSALAVQVAADEEADFFCCETGLGGRLDASNALPAIATLLTTVGLDHEAILGNTRPEIAEEKLGLLKKDTPLFCGVDDELRPLVFQKAVFSGSPVYFLDELARWQPESEDRPSGNWNLTLRKHLFRNLPGLGAESMRRNVALSLLALTELEALLDQKLLPADVSSALGNLFLPGRYQRLLRRPDFVFDTAHNEQALSGALDHFRNQETSGRRIVLFGAMHNKVLEKLPGAIVQGFDLLLAAPVSIPRSRNADELIDLLRAWGLDPHSVTSDLKDASGALVAQDLATGLQWLARNLNPDDRVLVTGSCFMVAEVMHCLGFTDLDMTRQDTPAGPVLASLNPST
jgi:dihydrofolate synthase / folylpolyglutamate synthase